jgi:hypothetical protein
MRRLCERCANMLEQVAASQFENGIAPLRGYLIQLLPVHRTRA